MLESLFRANVDPSAVALRVARGNYRYADMATDVRRCAAWISSRKITARSRVLLHALDPQLYWTLFFALESHGIVTIGESVKAEVDEEYLAFVGADVVFSSFAKPADVTARWVRANEAFRTEIRAFRPQPLSRRTRGAGDPICIVLSSGTTAAPKKVLLTRGMLDCRTVHAREAGFLKEGARLICLLPSSSIGGILSALQTWFVGGTLVHLNPDADWAHELVSGAINNVVAAPLHFERLLAALPGDMPRPDDLTVLCGGGTLTVNLRDRLQQRLTDDIIVGYGTTETGLVTKASGEVVSNSDEVAGPVLPWMEVQTIGADGRLQAPGQMGELRIAGEDVVDGYFEAPADTARHFRDGWFYPGDMGFVDSAGNLVIAGRVDDMMNFGGRKALPSVVESLAKGIPGINDAAAFSLPGEDGENVLWLAYSSANPIDERRLQQSLNLFPRIEIVRMAAIPRNALGKIERTLLRERAQQGKHILASL